MSVARMKGLGILPVVLCLLVASQPGLAQLPDRTGGVVPSPRDPMLEPPLPTTKPRISVDPSVRPQIIRDETRTVGTREQFCLPGGEAPRQVQVTATGPKSVTLSWQPAADAIGYRVYQARQGESGYTGGGFVAESTVTGGPLLPATTYSFKVSSVYPPEQNLCGGTSDPVSATTSPAPAPSGLKASVVGPGQVNLSWDALPGSDGFRLFRNDTMLVDLKRDTSRPVSPFNPSPPNPMATSFADVVPVGTYKYQIQAAFKSGDAEALSALAPTPPVSVTIEASTRVKYCQWGTSP